MDTEQKLQILGMGAHFDVGSAGSSPNRKPSGSAAIPGVFYAAGRDGKRVALLKVLMTNVCTQDCMYCPHRAEQETERRTSFKPEELADLFMDMYRRKLVEGIFLSSGIAGDPTKTMSRMVTVAELLRTRHEFPGYIHLKVMPGAERAVIERAAELVDRLSINMEAPSADHLACLSKTKNYAVGIVERMRWLSELKRSPELRVINSQNPQPESATPDTEVEPEVVTRQRTRSAKIETRPATILPAGITTQFIVGATGESDRDTYTSAAMLYREMGLTRAYFSAFYPVEGTPLEALPAQPATREHRLYQIDWLHRQYRFDMDEIEQAFDLEGNLPLWADPKVAIALRVPEQFPVDINSASYAQLLRVPGIGPISATRIVQAREWHSFRSPSELKAAGVVLKRALPFILLNGHKPEEAALARLALRRHLDKARRDYARQAEPLMTQLTLPLF